MMYRGVFRERRPDDYECPVCPVCGEECDTYYKQGGIVLGCDQCMEAVSAWEEIGSENL